MPTPKNPLSSTHRRVRRRPVSAQRTTVNWLYVGAVVVALAAAAVVRWVIGL